MIEARVRVQVAGEVLLSAWEALPGVTNPNEALADLRAGLARAIRECDVLTVPFGDGGRFVSGRHVEWFEVEVRSR